MDKIIPYLLYCFAIYICYCPSETTDNLTISDEKVCEPSEILCPGNKCRSISIHKLIGCCEILMDKHCSTGDCISYRDPCTKCGSGIGMIECGNWQCVNDSAGEECSTCLWSYRKCGNGKCVYEDSPCYAPCRDYEIECENGECQRYSSRCKCRDNRVKCSDDMYTCADSYRDCPRDEDNADSDETNYSSQLAMGFGFVIFVILLCLTIACCRKKIKANRACTVQMESVPMQNLNTQGQNRVEIQSNVPSHFPVPVGVAAPPPTWSRDVEGTEAPAPKPSEPMPPAYMPPAPMASAPMAAMTPAPVIDHTDPHSSRPLLPPSYEEATGQQC